MESSPLNKLPAELRNEIYELVLAQDKPLAVCKKHPDPESTAVQPPLTRVCRRIRNEALGMFYHYNNFVLEMVTSQLWEWSDNKLWGFPYEPESEDIATYCVEVHWSQREIFERRTNEVSRWLNGTRQKHHDTIKEAQVVIFTHADDWEDDWEEDQTERYNLETLVEKLRECGYGGIDGQQKLKATVHLVSKYTTDDELVWAYGASAYESPPEMKAKARNFFENLGLEVEVTWKRMWSHDGVTRVCRQIRSEAVEMFYHSNTFVAEIQANSEEIWSSQDGVIDTADRIEKWFNCMTPKSHAAIRDLQLPIVSGSWCFHSDIEEEFKYLIQTLKRLGLVGKKGEEE